MDTWTALLHCQTALLSHNIILGMIIIQAVKHSWYGQLSFPSIVFSGLKWMFIAYHQLHTLYWLLKGQEEPIAAKQSLIIRKVFQIIKKSICVLENLIYGILVEGGGETTIFYSLNNFSDAVFWTVHGYRTVHGKHICIRFQELNPF